MDLPAACKYIVENSQSVQAKFQALVTLREAAIREWAVTPAEQVVGIRRWALTLLLGHAASLDRLVAAQLSALFATLLKRGWEDTSDDQRRATFHEVEAAVAQAGSPHARRAGMQVLEAVVIEFSPGTASEIGLPWEHHHRCKSSLEELYLRDFFAHACAIGQQAAPAAVARQDGGTLAACLALVSSILHWDFGKLMSSDGAIGSSAAWGARGNLTDTILVKPGAAWRDLLVGPGAMQWLYDIVPVSRQGSLPPDAAGKARDVLVQLCGVCGDVFPNPQHEDPSQQPTLVKHLSSTLHAALALVHPLDAAIEAARAGTGEEEVVTACRCLNALASFHRAQRFEQAMPELQGQGGVLAVICQLTQGVYAQGGLSEDAEGTWVHVCAELLLETWSSLLASVHYEGGVTSLHETVQVAAAQAFEAIVSSELANVSRGALEEADAAEELGQARAEERITDLAAMGRAVPAQSMARLSSAIHASIDELRACLQSHSDPSEPLERLCFVVETAGAVLADPGEGEIPMVPVPISQAFRAADQGLLGHCPVERLAKSVLGVFCLPLDPALRPAASPRLMEVAGAAVARIADTYILTNEEEHSQAFRQSFGAAPGHGAQAVEQILNACLACLGSYPGEGALHRVVAKKVLFSLVKHRPEICRACLSLPSWETLTDAFARSQPPFPSIDSKHHRAVAVALAQVTQVCQSSEQAGAYMERLVHQPLEDLTHLAAQANLRQLAQQGNVEFKTLCHLERLRGLNDGLTPKCQRALWSAMMRCFDPMLAIMPAFVDSPLVTGAILKLASSAVSGHVAFLSASDFDAVCSFVMRLIKQFSSLNLQQVHLAQAGPEAIREGRAEDRTRALTSLLKLLTKVMDRDFVELLSEEGASAYGAHEAPGTIALAGLDLLLPVMDPELLRFPRLCKSYFALVGLLAEAHADRVGLLPEDLFLRLLRTIEFGAAQPDAAVAQESIDSLAHLATYHFKETAVANNAGLGRLATEPLAGLDGLTVFTHFQHTLLRHLIFEDNTAEITDSAADALLPMILCDQAGFRSFGEGLVSNASDPAVQQVLAGALNALMAPENTRPTLELKQRRLFRKVLRSFLITVRGVLRRR
ncbi:unnamed protein product [Pedinophyceae sp. YPF-701]|nr:unnamed protein product [Pedinophyceae sp. YPF-701]